MDAVGIATTRAGMGITPAGIRITRTIPGTVGASEQQNSGGRGGKEKDALVPSAQLQSKYRHSVGVLLQG